MHRIYKYPLIITDKQEIEMPKNAKILCVQAQNDMPCIWALVDKYESAIGQTRTRTFYTYGTGHDIGRPEILNYIGTYQLHSGALVFHLFELQ